MKNEDFSPEEFSMLMTKIKESLRELGIPELEIVTEKKDEVVDNGISSEELPVAKDELVSDSTRKEQEFFEKSEPVDLPVAKDESISDSILKERESLGKSELIESEDIIESNVIENVVGGFEDPPSAKLVPEPLEDTSEQQYDIAAYIKVVQPEIEVATAASLARTIETPKVAVEGIAVEISDSSRQTYCLKCQTPILEAEGRVEIKDKFVHSDCFCCTVCETKFGKDEQFVALDGLPYCRLHYDEAKNP